MPFLSLNLIRQYSSAATFEEAYLACIEGSLSGSEIITMEHRKLKYTARDAGHNTASIFLRGADGRIERAECDCRQRGPLWCRHVVTALLVAVYKSDTIIRLDAIDNAMESANKSVLQDILRQHCMQHPEFSVQLTRLLKGAKNYLT